MTENLSNLHRDLKRTNLAIFAIVGLLVLLTLAMYITTSSVQQEQAMSLRSQAVYETNINKELTQDSTEIKQIPQVIIDSASKCPASGRRSGKDTGFGNLFTCTSICADGSKGNSQSSPGGYSQDECNSIAEGFCGCPSSKVTPVLDCQYDIQLLNGVDDLSCPRETVSCPAGKFGGANITCASGKQYGIIRTGSGTTCYTDEVWQQAAKAVCCTQPYQGCMWSSHDGDLCNATCQETFGKSCTVHDTNPHYSCCSN